MKKNIFLIVYLFISNSLLSQSVILRPYLGVKRFATSQRNTGSNNFDPSFSSRGAFTNHSVGIAVEYNLKAVSYELCFTAQGGLFNFSSYHQDAGIGIQHKTDLGFNQIQAVSSYCFLKFDKSDKTINITPIISIGMGLGFVPPQSYFDNDPYIEHIIVSNNPNEFFDINFTIKRQNKISLSSIVKAGFLIHTPIKEIFRLQLIANIGLNEALRSDLIYYHSSKKYSGTLSSYGSHIGILASMPIYIKRFRKK